MLFVNAYATSAGNAKFTRTKPANAGAEKAGNAKFPRKKTK